MGFESTYRPRTERSRPDPVALALRALAWIVADPERADRFLALTGLDVAALRARAGDPALLAAAIAFLEGNEADLVACAGMLAIAPDALVAAGRELVA